MRVFLDFTDAEIARAYDDAFAATFARDARRVARRWQVEATAQRHDKRTAIGREGLIALGVLIGAGSLALLSWPALRRRRRRRRNAKLSKEVTSISVQLP